jgi:hypothetical protein
MLLNDDTLSVDSNGELAYFDVLAPGEAGSEGSELPTAAPLVTGPEFQLSSLPGAAKTIYLDFDGHVTTGTTWNSQYGVPTITSPPYDTNGNPDTWSSSELETIAKTWAVVAEDFAPWNINVTTIDPGVEALRRSGSGDTQWGARVVITDDTFANCGCGGHAYIGAFDDSVDEPTFVYNRSFVGVSEASSHEVGHMLNLAHDGTRSVSYYEGHDASGSPGWAPIMGVAYYQPVTQWSQQEYYNANNSGSSANYNNGPDDLAIISSFTNGNGFGLKTDDHGNDLASSTPLNGDTPSSTGIISTRTDVDVFSFSTLGGSVSFAAGTVVASSNPPDGLNASVTTTLAAGTYSVEIDGVGVGTPGNNPPSGYTDYASLGQYTLTGTIDSTTPLDTTPPAKPAGLTATENGGAVELGWSAIANTDGDLAGYVVRRSTTSGSGYADIATVDAGSTSYTDSSIGSGTYYYVIAAIDTSGNPSLDSAEVSVVIAVNLTTFATSETAVYGTVSGSLQNTWAAGDQTQTITEVDSGGKPKNRHDRAEHRWSIPSSEGGHTLTVVATAKNGGDADTGFTLQWTSNGSTWITLDTFSQGQSASARTYDLGGLIGTIQVRSWTTTAPGGNSVTTRSASI